MVSIIDGNLVHAAHALKTIGSFRIKNVRFVAAQKTNQRPYPGQIIKIVPYTCAPIYELPPNISTMQTQIGSPHSSINP